MPAISEDHLHNLPPKDRRYDAPVADELVLNVFPNGVKTWVHVYLFEDFTRRRTIGVFPDMGLDEALASLKQSQQVVQLDAQESRRSDETPTTPTPLPSSKSRAVTLVSATVGAAAIAVVVIRWILAPATVETEQGARLENPASTVGEQHQAATGIIQRPGTSTPERPVQEQTESGADTAGPDDAILATTVDADGPPDADISRPTVTDADTLPDTPTTPQETMTGDEQPLGVETTTLPPAPIADQSSIATETAQDPTPEPTTAMETSTAAVTRDWGLVTRLDRIGTPILAQGFDQPQAAGFDAAPVTMVVGARELSFDSATMPPADAAFDSATEPPEDEVFASATEPPADEAFASASGTISRFASVVAEPSADEVPAGWDVPISAVGDTPPAMFTLDGPDVFPMPSATETSAPIGVPAIGPRQDVGVPVAAAGQDTLSDTGDDTSSTSPTTVASARTVRPATEASGNGSRLANDATPATALRPAAEVETGQSLAPPTADDAPATSVARSATDGTQTAVTTDDGTVPSEIVTSDPATTEDQIDEAASLASTDVSGSSATQTVTDADGEPSPDATDESFLAAVSEPPVESRPELDEGSAETVETPDPVTLAAAEDRVGTVMSGDVAITSPEQAAADEEPSRAGPETPEESILVGEVVKVRGTLLTLRALDGSGRRAYRVPRGATVLLDGVDTRLQDLLPGQVINIKTGAEIRAVGR